MPRSLLHVLESPLPTHSKSPVALLPNSNFPRGSAVELALDHELLPHHASLVPSALDVEYAVLIPLNSSIMMLGPIVLGIREGQPIRSTVQVAGDL